MLSTQSAPFELHFSAPMDCQQIAKDLQIKSTSPNNQTARLDMESVRCSHISNSPDTMSSYSGTVNTTWAFKATLINVNDGIHQISVNNISTAANRSVTTNSHDHFLLRVGQSDNPMVFPGSANYSSSMLFRDHADKKLYVLHKAPGADKFRYSLNFGTTYSDWEDYPIGINATSPLAPKVWSGTKLQDWKGEHVIVEYWSHLVGSSDHVQHADLDHGPFQRQFPNVFLEGTFNQYGFDKGFANQMWMNANNTWSFDFVHEWPAYVSLNLWGINPDGQPDKTRIYGDIDGDSILDRIPPASLIDNVVNITDPPPSPFLGWQITFNDADYRYQLIPIGSRWNQLILYMLLWLVPPLTGAAAVWAFVKSFYGVKLNELGITTKKGFEVGDLTRHFKRRKVQDLPKTSNRPKPSFFRPSGFSVSHKPKDPSQFAQTARRPSTFAESNQFVQTARRPSTFVESNQFVQTARRPSTFGESNQFVQTARRASTMIPSPMVKRLTVLIATMEYDVEDWGIKVKIGGLGVMSSLMGKNLKHQDLIWVIPW